MLHLRTNVHGTLKSLNHKCTATTAIYARLDLDPVRASLEKATTAMLVAAGLKSEVELDFHSTKVAKK